MYTRVKYSYEFYLYKIDITELEYDFSYSYENDKLCISNVLNREGDSSGFEGDLCELRDMLDCLSDKGVSILEGYFMVSVYIDNVNCAHVRETIDSEMLKFFVNRDFKMEVKYFWCGSLCS